MVLSGGLSIDCHVHITSSQDIEVHSNSGQASLAASRFSTC